MDEDEDNNNNERSKGPSNADAFSALETAMECTSQSTDTMTLPANGTAFAFFGAGSPFSVHCFVSAVK
ncbi:hypothetical protein TNCV_1598431 [Trichonephila clavipes]|nr:hypothetical protein TNCV_1598431 [Trichonephila clavipes]